MHCEFLRDGEWGGESARGASTCASASSIIKGGECGGKRARGACTPASASPIIKDGEWQGGAEGMGWVHRSNVPQLLFYNAPCCFVPQRSTKCFITLTKCALWQGARVRPKLSSTYGPSLSRNYGQHYQKGWRCVRQSGSWQTTSPSRSTQRMMFKLH